MERSEKISRQRMELLYSPEEIAAIRGEVTAFARLAIDCMHEGEVKRGLRAAIELLDHARHCVQIVERESP